MKSMFELDVPVPSKRTLIVRNNKEVSKEQREIALKETEYNILSRRYACFGFSF